MKKIPFWKMSGSGNDFVLIDNRRRVLNGNAASWAKKLCHRQFGVGADGLLLLQPSDVRRRTAFRMVYFNADGSRADMCGNGARCMAYFAKARGVVGNVFDFQTDAYPVKARVKDAVVRVSLANPKEWRPKVSARVGSQIYHTAFLNTGVPHAVLFVRDAEKINLSVLGRALRFHRAFGPKGTNVNFVEKLGPHRLRVRTYERGVEAETLACGTGVTAAAIAAVLNGKVRAPVQCVTTGGDTLLVDFVPQPGSIHPATRVSLEGPVRVTFQGEFYA